MARARENDSSESHVGETGGMRAERGYRWNFPRLSFLSDVMSSGGVAV